MCIIYQAPKIRAITGSDDCSELDIKPDVNWPASCKLRKSTTVYIQCEKFFHSWTWSLLYFNWLPKFKNHPGIVYPIKCSCKIHRGFLVILYPKSSGRVIDIDFIITFMTLKHKGYILCYGILNYDDSIIFNMLSHIFRISDILKLFKSVKKLQTFIFLISIYTNIGSYKIPFT